MLRHSLCKGTKLDCQTFVETACILPATTLGPPKIACAHIAAAAMCTSRESRGLGRPGCREGMLAYNCNACGVVLRILLNHTCNKKCNMPGPTLISCIYPRRQKPCRHSFQRQYGDTAYSTRAKARAPFLYRQAVYSPNSGFGGNIPLVGRGIQL